MNEKILLFLMDDLQLNYLLCNREIEKFLLNVKIIFYFSILNT